MGELLCEELIEEILSRLHNINYLIKCKYVSKSWNRLVSNVCCQGGPTVGLIGLYATNVNHVTSSNELRILCPAKKQVDDDDHDDNVDTKQVKPRLVEKNEIDCMMETTKCLELYQLTQLLDSCNGLILWRCFDEGKHCYYVGNPILNQWTLLPPPKKDYCATSGFAFDGIHGHHYKIVHLFISEMTEPVTNRIRCKVFYSETGQWRERQAKVLNSLATLSHCIKLIRGSSTQKQGLYLNGALHWTFALDHKYMLVFYVEKEVVRFIELPGDNIVDRMAKCLWESKGFLHYAVSVEGNTFHVWKNTNDHGNDNKQQRWVFIQTIRYASMVRGYLQEDPSKCWLCIDEGCSSSKSSIVCVPIEYLNNDGSRAVNSATILKYFCDTGVLDESSAKMPNTQRVSWEYTSTTNGISRGCFRGALYPYVFNLVDLPIWDGCILLKRPVKGDPLADKNRGRPEQI